MTDKILNDLDHELSLELIEPLFLVQGNSKPQEMVSVRSLHAIDAIAESLVCRISLCSLRSLTTIELQIFGSVRERKLIYPPVLVHMKVKSSQRQKQNVTVCAACARKPQTSEMLNLFTTQSSRSRSDDSTWLSFCVVTFAPTKPL